MMRAYYWDMDEYGCAVIASTAQEAKTWLWSYSDVRDCCNWEWINLKVRWIRDVDTTGLPIGEVDEMEGLKRGIYSCLHNAKCPLCHKTRPLENWHGVIGCSECLEIGSRQMRDFIKKDLRKQEDSNERTDS